MGDDDRSAALHDLTESNLDKTLRLFIQSTRGLIKKQDRWLTNDGSSDSDTLLLTSRKLATAVTGEDRESVVQVDFAFGSRITGIDQVNDIIELSRSFSLGLELSKLFDLLIVSGLANLCDDLVFVSLAHHSLLERTRIIVES